MQRRGCHSFEQSESEASAQPPRQVRGQKKTLILWMTFLLRTLYSGQEATVRTGHGTTDWLQIGKEYVKAVYCHPAYLTSIQSTSCEVLGWMKHKLESRLPGEISITSDMQMTPHL